MAKRKYKDIAGQRFGKLVAIEKTKSNSDKDLHAHWKCICDCGNTCIVSGSNLRKGITKSCGCINDGRSRTRLYRIWIHIKNRCNNPTDNAYPHYGGRGITMCDEWLINYRAFSDWAIANGYNDGLTIDRINNNKGYSSDNCRWVTMREQSLNRRNNRYINYNNETKTVNEWAQQMGIKQNTLLYRIRRGWSAERALTTRCNNGRIDNPER